MSGTRKAKRSMADPALGPEGDCCVKRMVTPSVLTPRSDPETISRGAHHVAPERDCGIGVRRIDVDVPRGNSAPAARRLRHRRKSGKATNRAQEHSC